MENVALDVKMRTKKKKKKRGRNSTWGSNLGVVPT